MDRDELYDDITEVGADTMGAAVGAGIGLAVAGPGGSVVGAMAGSIVSNIINKVGDEIKERFLSKKETERVETVIELSKKYIGKKLKQGMAIRTDKFFDEKINERSSAEEILEGVLISAQREYEEMKIPFLAKIYSNIIFDSSISRTIANQLLKISSDLTFRQIIILGVIGKFQMMKPFGDPRKKQASNSVSGLNNVSIASDIYDLYQKSLLSSDSIIFGPANINPSHLMISGYGALLYNLMELKSMKLDDEMAQAVISFLV